MKIVKGNKIIDLARDEFVSLAEKFERVVIDLGCGDGRFVYKSALLAPKTLWIGVEPAIKQTEEFARKMSRNKVHNALLIVGSLEMMPTELNGVADKVFIILPWGSLLGAIAKPTTENIINIKDCLKKGGELEIIFGYDKDLEPNLTSKFELDRIDEDYVLNHIVPEFEKNGFKFNSYENLNNTTLRDLESTWGKRIYQRNERPLSKLVFSVVK